MLQAVHGLQLTTDVVLSSGVVEVLDSRVRLIIGAEDLLGLKNPFGELTVSRMIPKDSPQLAVTQPYSCSGATHLSGL